MVSTKATWGATKLRAVSVAAENPAHAKSPENRQRSGKGQAKIARHRVGRAGPPADLGRQKEPRMHAGSLNQFLVTDILVRLIVSGPSRFFAPIV